LHESILRLFIMPGGIHPPLKVMATWPTPNYRNPDTYPKTVFISACILGPLTLCLLFVRLWVRVRLQHSAGWDDWLMLVAMVSLWIPLYGLYVKCNRSP
jgi:hypothetical protein